MAGIGVLFLAALLVGGVALWKMRTPVGDGEGGSAGAATATPTPESADGQLAQGLLRVTAQPIGAAVAVNGEPRGAAPLEATLPLGLYEVQVSHEGYVTQAHAVELSATKPLGDLDVRLEAAVVERKAVADIVSKPPGARVLVDGREVGRTPLRDLDIDVGERRIEILRDGFRPDKRTVLAQAGRKVSVAVSLVAGEARRVLPTPTPRIETVDVNRVFLPREVDKPPKKTSGDYPDPTGLPKLKSGERVSVSVAFVVTETGEVADVEVLESGGGERLNEAVVKAVKRWRFEPGVKAGTKVKVRQSQKFTYQVG